MLLLCYRNVNNKYNRTRGYVKWSPGNLLGQPIWGLDHLVLMSHPVTVMHTVQQHVLPPSSATWPQKLKMWAPSRRMIRSVFGSYDFVELNLTVLAGCWVAHHVLVHGGALQCGIRFVSGQCWPWLVAPQGEAQLVLVSPMDGSIAFGWDDGVSPLTSDPCWSTGHRWVCLLGCMLSRSCLRKPSLWTVVWKEALSDQKWRLWWALQREHGWAFNIG